MTNWCGEAWKKLNSGDYNDYFKKCWETTGCLIIANGSEDDKIKPEGLPNYKVPPPIDYIEAMIATHCDDFNQNVKNIHDETKIHHSYKRKSVYFR